ncbi:MAG: glycosyltransferase family 39 protein [Muribaculaceae bacterium]|nr:glycosyltransferase family 39 protein [Muribaculaceae bacterium]
MSDSSRLIPGRPSNIWWETFIVAVLLILTFIPFLGENLYSTKGEPREAVIAVAMLNSGDWVLPVTFGAEIPYKPPMLAWCIALLGSVNGGVVTEFLSRVPSALAVIIMILAGFRIYARRSTVNLAMAAALITAGSFELFRSATICRVDMLLTMFIVTALYAFYRQWCRHPQGTWAPSIWAALLMSGGVLTKGPVGMLLPCMVIFVFRLMRGNGFWQTVVSTGVSALLSLVLPAMWYIAAFQRGGDEFLRLAMEENFGRFTGTMSYESHENPAWYNLLTLSYGLLPATLLLLMSVFARPWKYVAKAGRHVRFTFRGLWHKLCGMDPLELFSLLAAVLIFVFYCIPKSKRSAYLLPVYPFVAYFIAVYARWLVRHLPRMVKAYCWIIGVIGFVASGAVIAVMAGLVPEIDNAKLQPVIESLEDGGHRFRSVALCILALLGAIWLGRELVCAKARSGFGWTMVYTLVMYWMVQCAVLPSAMNVKSDKPLAETISAALPDGPVYSYRPDPMMRYYVANYYLNDRLRLFDVEQPRHGFLLVGEADFQAVKDGIGKKYDFVDTGLDGLYSNETRQRMLLLKFARL